VQKHLLIGFFLLYFSSFGQKFGENNPVWHYVQTSSLNGNRSIIPIQHIKDTTILGKLSVKLSNGYFHHNDNDSVFFFDKANNSFYLLYDFSRLAGESFYLDFWDLSVDVESVSTIEINGQTKKTYVYSTDHIAFDFSGLVIEGIGMVGGLGGMFPYAELTSTQEFRCYEDDVVGLYTNIINSEICDILSTVTLTPSNLTIYPNPVTTELKINIPSNLLTTIAIKDVTGKTIFTQEVMQQNNIALLVDFIPPGFYFLIVNNDLVFRFIKN
jgi:hypothetical protein